jgi:hypothetical protein
MLTLVEEKFTSLVQFAKEHRNALIAAACIVAFVIVMISAIALVLELKADVLDYEGKIAIMSSRMERWEQAAEDNEILTAENSAVRSENDLLSAKNSDLTAANGELERQNGELLKKFNGLSKPN